MFRTWKNEQDIDTVVDEVMSKRDGDLFYHMAETYMFRALCLYIYETQETDNNLSSVITLLKNNDINSLSVLMKQLSEQNPESKAVLNWEAYDKAACGLRSVPLALLCRLHYFNETA